MTGDGIDGGRIEAGGAEDWRAALPDDIRGHSALEGFDGIEALAREHVHLQRLIGRKGIVPPGEDAGEEERARFYESLGRPAAPEDYDLSDLARPDGMPWSEQVERQMLARMHAVGLTNEQTRGLVAAYGEVQGTAWEAACAAEVRTLTETTEALRRDWGDAFDARLDLANRAFAAAFGEEVETARRLRLADGSWLGDNPQIVRAFAAIGARMGEAEFVGPKQPALGQSRAEAAAELAGLEGDPDFRAALLDRSHPEHRAALARRSALARRAWDPDEEPENAFGMY